MTDPISGFGSSGSDLDRDLSRLVQSESEVNQTAALSFNPVEFWLTHDQAIGEHGAPSEIMLSHNLYRGMPAWFNAFYAHFQQRALLRLLRRCDVHPGMIGLDLGCGTGRWTGLMLEMGLRPYGVDMGERALQVASGFWRGARFVLGMLPYLCFARGSFDLAVSVTVLQHIPRPQQLEAIEAVAYALKPDGYLIACETTDTGDPSAHVFGNKLARWLELFNSAGFQLIGQDACEYLPYVKILHQLRRLGRTTVEQAHAQGDVSRVAHRLRSQPVLTLLMRLLIAASYPAEYFASVALPNRCARLACFLLKRT